MKGLFGANEDSHMPDTMAPSGITSRSKWEYLPKLLKHQHKKLSLKQVKNKLAPKFYGPFRINKKISKVAYRLELPDNFRIHNIFHISCLKKVLGKVNKFKHKSLTSMTKGELF